MCKFELNDNKLAHVHNKTNVFTLGKLRLFITFSCTKSLEINVSQYNIQ